MQAMNPQRKAFLDMLAWSEGTSKSPATKCDGYDVIVTGVDGKPEVFTDFSDHPFNKGRPSKKINSKGLTSNASGRYQFMLKDWAHYKTQLGLPDFGPASQDQWALQLIKERKAIPDIDAGNIRRAIDRCSNIWASLPGAGYGQFEHKAENLIAKFKEAGGKVNEPKS
jgi:muramidase (phage lysozyme)